MNRRSFLATLFAAPLAWLGWKRKTEAVGELWIDGVDYSEHLITVDPLRLHWDPEAYATHCQSCGCRYMPCCACGRTRAIAEFEAERLVEN